MTISPARGVTSHTLTTMRWWGSLFAIVLATGCTKHNPAHCCTTTEECAAAGLDTTYACADGLVCYMNNCVVPECTAAVDCAPEHECVRNVCVPATPDAPVVPPSWAKHVQGSGAQAVEGIAVAPDGSVFVVGTFEQTIDLGGGPLTAAGARDFFVAKFLANGAHAWSRQFGTTYATANEIAVLPDGDVAIAGWFRNSLPIGSTTLNTSGVNDDVFVARLSSSGGEPIWARSGGGSSVDRTADLDVDQSGSIVVCGTTLEGGTFFGSAITASSDPWVARLGSDGTLVWAKALNTNGPEASCAIAGLADGDVAAVGSYIGTVNLGGMTLTSTSSASYDFFLTRLSGSSGAPVWAVTKGGTASVEAVDVVSHDGAVVVAGRFAGSATLGGSAPLVAEGTDAFVARFEASNATHTYSTRMGGSAYDEAIHLSARPDGQVSVAGHFAGTATFGSTMLVGGQVSDAFVADVDGTGAIVDVMSIVGPTGEVLTSVVSTNEALCVGGVFNESIVMLGQTYQTTSPDGFLVRIKR